MNGRIRCLRNVLQINHKRHENNFKDKKYMCEEWIGLIKIENKDTHIFLYGDNAFILARKKCLLHLYYIILYEPFYEYVIEIDTLFLKRFDYCDLYFPNNFHIFFSLSNSVCFPCYILSQ